MQTPPSRQAVIDEIWRAHPNDHEARIRAWVRTDLTGVVPESEWAAAHAGACAICGGEEARLYASGWRDDKCKPRKRGGC